MRPSRSFAPVIALVLATTYLHPVAVAAAGTEDTTPPDTYVYAQPGAFTGPRVVIEFRGTPGDVDHIECRLDAGTWLNPCPYPWSMTLSGGPHEAEGRAVDTAGNADPTPAQVSFVVDDVGPVGQVAINGGAATTGRFRVHLDVANSDQNEGHEVWISNDPAVDDQGLLLHAWAGYQSQLRYMEAWDLSDSRYGGSAGDGVRTVYVQFRDQFQNLGPVASDSILVQPGITPVVIRLGVTENPAPLGGLTVIRATAEAADGAAIPDGVFRLHCPDEDPYTPATGARELALECLSYSYWAGSHSLTASFSGSSELADGSAAMILTVGPARDQEPPRIQLGPTGAFDPAAAQQTFDLSSSHHEAVSFECRIDDGSWSTCGPTWTVANPGPGLHVLAARGRDLGGTWSTVDAVFPWRVGSLPPGRFAVDDVMIGAANATTQPVQRVSLTPEATGPLVARVSSSRALDALGRLADAIEVPVPSATQVELDVEDAATGGSPGDGLKWIVVQWQNADETWSVPSAFAFILDRAAPTLAVVLNAGRPFVDDDEVLLLPKSNEAISVFASTDRSRVENAGPLEGSFGYAVVRIGDIPFGTIATRTIYARASDRVRLMGSIVSATLTIDRSNPTAAVGAASFVLGSRVSSTSLAVRLTATARDTGSGVARSTLQEAISSQPFTSIATVSSGVISVVRTLSPTVTRTYRVRGVDRLGHVGPWTLGPGLRPYLRDDRSTSVRYTSFWRSLAASSALRWTLRRSATSGATASLSFTGRAVGIVAPRGPGHGRAAIYIDGKYITTIDLRSSVYQSRTVVFTRSWSVPGAHRIMLKVLGTVGRPTVDLDGFVVMP